MIRRGAPGRRRERGAAAIEFAIILPVLLTILLGILDYGWFFYCKLACTNAAREGARAGTTVPGGAPDKAKTIAENYLTNAGLGSQSTTVSVSTGSSPTSITVDVTMSYTPLVGFVPLPAKATAHAVMMGVP